MKMHPSEEPGRYYVRGRVGQLRHVFNDSDWQRPVTFCGKEILPFPSGGSAIDRLQHGTALTKKDYPDAFVCPKCAKRLARADKAEVMKLAAKGGAT